MTDDRNEPPAPPPEPPVPPQPPVPPLAPEPPVPPLPPEPPVPPVPPPLPPVPPVTPPPPPPVPPPTPVHVPPARATPWGWLVAGLLALILLVLVILYFTGALDTERRVPVGPVTPVPVTGGSTGNPGSPADPATTPPTTSAAGQVSEQWLLGSWGQDCPSGRPDLVFEPGGRLLFDPDVGSWTLSGNNVTIMVNGRDSRMTWDYMGQDSARVTRLRTGDVYFVTRCPS